MMEPMTVFVLTFQLFALFSIAGALLLYLIYKVRDDNNGPPVAQSAPVLITSADTALGLQLCTHLATKGCRVFAGMKEPKDSLPAKLLSRWLDMRDMNDEPLRGVIIPMQLDVTREDVLREMTNMMGAHLNEGERGIAAVINTSGCVFRGTIEQQEVLMLEHMLKTNVLGSLRVVKSFLEFLQPTQGRLIYLGSGAGSGSEGLVAFSATRMAVEKCAEELRRELQPHGVKVITLDTRGMTAESLYKAPEPYIASNEEGAPTQYTADVLSISSLRVIERALWDAEPQHRYQLVLPASKLDFLLPCRASLRMHKLTEATKRGSVQRV